MIITIHIRNASQPDMIHCATLVNQWIDQHDWLPRVFSSKEIDANFCKGLLEKRKTRVVTVDHNVVGFSMLAGETMITALHVSKHMRSKGIGSLLLNDIKKHAIKPLELWAHGPNVRAHQFYKREGFTHTKTDAASSDEGLDEYCFEWWSKSSERLL